MRVGVTGHQKLDDASIWPWVEKTITEELDRFPMPLVAVSSLAIGADQLLARLVLGRGGQLHAVLPFSDYERIFYGEGLIGYRNLIGTATIEVLDTPGDDE